MTQELHMEITAVLREIVWRFGSQGANGNCCGNLSIQEMKALRTVADHTDCSMQNLAKALELTKSGATRIVDRLQKKQMVQRRRNAADGRVCCVLLTAAGADMIAQADREAQDRVAQVIGRMDAGMQQVLRTALHAFSAAMRKGDPLPCGWKDESEAETSLRAGGAG